MAKFKISLRRTKYDTNIEEEYVVKKQISFLKIFKWWVVVPYSENYVLETFDTYENAKDYIINRINANKEWWKIKNRKR